MNKLEVVEGFAAEDSQEVRVDGFGLGLFATDDCRQDFVTLSSAQSAIAKARKEAFDEAAKVAMYMPLRESHGEYIYDTDAAKALAWHTASLIRALGKEQG